MTGESELLAAIQDSNKWLRLLVLPSLRTRLLAELKTPEDHSIYQESDGRSIREVAASAGVGFATVQGRWQEWAKKDMLEKTETPGRFRRIVDLRELGMIDDHESRITDGKPAPRSRSAAPNRSKPRNKTSA
jgi:hypothetical protein